MHIKNILFILFLFSVNADITGQTIEMSLEEIQNRIIQHNLDLQIASSDYKLREADFKQSRAMYYPNISLNYTGISTSSPLMAFGSKLNQSIISQSDFDPTLLNDPDPTQNFSLQLSVQQPILNFDKKHQRNAARLGMEAVSFQSERIKDHLLMASSQLYLQLQFTYKAIDVIKQAINTAESNKKIAQNNLDAGYMQEADLLLIDVRINELKNNLLFTQNQIKDISDQLHTMMLSEQFEVIKPIGNFSQLDLNNQIEVEMERADFKAMDKANQAYSELIKSEQKTFLPKLNAFGTFETNDNNPITTNSTNYLVGLQVSWNIFDGMQRSARIQKAEANLNKGQLSKQKLVRESKTKLKKSIRDYHQALEKLETVQLAIQQAQESLRIKTNRFEQGLEKATDILMAETIYAEKQLLEHQTVMEINMAILNATFLSTSTK